MSIRSKQTVLSSEWPRTPKGKLKINNGTLELFAEGFPEIKKLKRIFNLLNSAKLAEYIISEDGRYRPYGGFKMFGTHTGRCAPWACSGRLHAARAACLAGTG